MGKIYLSKEAEQDLFEIVKKLKNNGYERESIVELLEKIVYEIHNNDDIWNSIGGEKNEC